MSSLNLQGGQDEDVPQLASQFRQASKLISIGVTILGIVVVCGWMFNVPILTAVRPAFASMKANTAMLFVWLGAALWMANNSRWWRSRSILGLLVVVVAGLTLGEYAFNIDLGIDQLLFRDATTPAAAYPGRMALSTAFCFLLLGLATLPLQSRRALLLQRGAVLVCLALSLVALCGYMYGVQSLYSITSFASMAVHTAAGLAAACLAYFLSRPEEGIVLIAASESNAGFLLRRLLPPIVLLPIVLGWVRLAGQRANLYDTTFGVALLVLANIGCMTLVTLLIVRSLYSSEAQRHESEERFRLVANTAPVMIWMSGPDKLCNYFNQPWLEFTGRSLEAELGNGWTEGVHPEDLKFCLDTYTSAFDRRESFKMHYRLRRNDGEYRWLFDVGVPRYNANGSFAGYIGSCTDITERKIAEEAVQHSEERLRLAQQTARIGTFDWNIRTGVNTWTPELEAMYGLPPGGFGQTQTAFEKLIHPDDRATVVALVDLAFKRGQPMEAEWRTVWPDGSIHWISGRWRVLSDDSGEPSRMIGVNMDVTQRKLAEDALANLSARLINAQEEERKRIARELHDDYSQRLALLAIDLDRFAEDDAGARVDRGSYLRELSNRASKLGMDLHSLSHQLHSSTLKTLGLVAGVKAFCEEFEEQQGVQVDFVHENVPSGIPEDVALCLFRIAQEALRNVKRHSGADRSQVHLEYQDGRLQLEISDRGKGFDSKKPAAERGIGIQSMEERLRALGGHLEIYSEPTKGARLIAWLPLRVELAASANSAIPALNKTH